MFISNRYRVTITFLFKVIAQKYPTAQYPSEICVWRVNVSVSKRQAKNCFGAKTYWRHNVLAPKHLGAKTRPPKLRRQDIGIETLAPKRGRSPQAI